MKWSPLWENLENKNKKMTQFHNMNKITTFYHKSFYTLGYEILCSAYLYTQAHK